jgi:hypothetical protein
MEDDNSFHSGDREDCATSTMCYNLLSSQLVLPDNLISAFQQGHQAFPLVNLKDNFISSLDNTYHHFLPMAPICLGHAFAQYPDLHLYMTVLYCFHAMPSSSKHLAINMGRDHFYDKSPNAYSLTIHQ